MTLAALGWQRFPAEAATRNWADHALPAARAAVTDPANAQWHVCEGTWFVGVDALPNDMRGRVGQGPDLSGAAVDAIRIWQGAVPGLHAAQISVTYPGYPRPRTGESDAAFRFRLKRDAAHVDGVLAEGPERRRFIREPHAFILGLALTDADANAAPLVVWEGSHNIMRRAFARAFETHPPEHWSNLDVTDIYVAARREVFETCRRIEQPLAAGETILVHPLLVHGVAPWAGSAQAGPDGRMVAYFRPLLGSVAEWLRL
ncbi:MAG: phytanoyl-CoA dioxygenase family protein [Rhodobacteraceae bacterium]|nr:phytanoyl-CoA dioxygenase family protein [Paracoccaceae bacterium]